MTVKTESDRLKQRTFASAVLASEQNNVSTSLGREVDVLFSGIASEVNQCELSQNHIEELAYSVPEVAAIARRRPLLISSSERGSSSNAEASFC